ncbi:sensor histidine kinase [Propionicicella superfundia]|uniref:sensor histidine kinase n=1 Tax=Propionicicella superfundia TaxID=348582 RepID=UPI0003F85201|nr:histidine kinase N-terminal domain-containing protein [Propionicicella superfundia]
MLTTAQVIAAHTDLDAEESAQLERLVDEWGLLADLSFSDLILWVPDVDDNVFWAAAQLRPNTGPTALEDDVVGDDIFYDPEHLVTEAYLSREISRTSGNKLNAGIPVDVVAIPIVRSGRCIGVVEMHTNRMGVRAPGALEDSYLDAANKIVDMMFRGEYPMAGAPTVPWLSPRVGDGMIYADRRGFVTFASPNALSAFRHLGLSGDLEGESLTAVVRELIPGHNRAPVERPLLQRKLVAHEVDLEGEGEISLRLRILPITDEKGPAGQLVLVRDVSELRERERQLVTKDATIREIHHRVKNNLQTVAALLRLQSRRIQSPPAKEALQDAMKRVQSIALVHEILSQQFDGAVAFDEIADRLMGMVAEAAVVGNSVTVKREGSFGRVPAEVATNLSLVLTELCQNAVEHGFPGRRGQVLVEPVREGSELVVEVSNDGLPLPLGFDLNKTDSLGLSIVVTLVHDMGGSFTLATPPGRWTVATVRIPLAPPEGHRRG